MAQLNYKPAIIASARRVVVKVGSAVLSDPDGLRADVIDNLASQIDSIIGGGYWLRYRSRKVACAESEVCAQPLPNRVVTIGLILATVLVVGALALDFLAPFFL